MTTSFKDNSEKSRFEYEVDGVISFANYRKDGSTLYIDYVESPVSLRGTGAAGTLMQHITDAAKKESLKIVPYCGYARAWIAKNTGGTQKPKI